MSRRRQGRKIKAKKHIDADALEFWDTLIDAVAVFRGTREHAHPSATYRGCAILPVKNKPWARQFRFITRNELEAIVTIDYRKAAQSPESYFHNMMEALNQTMKEINAEGRVYILPRQKPVAAGLQDMKVEIRKRQAHGG